MQDKSEELHAIIMWEIITIITLFPVIKINKKIPIHLKSSLAKLVVKPSFKVVKAKKNRIRKNLQFILNKILIFIKIDKE